jgi:hypothetical protein
VPEPDALGQPVFSIGEHTYTWRDVVRYAEVVGAWQEIAEEASMRVAADACTAVDPDDVDAAASAFRRERGLLSADDLDAWLERRGVSMDEWLAYVRGSLADAEAAGNAAAPPDAIWAEAVCSGSLEELAGELADRLAVAPETPFEELEASFEAYGAEVASAEAVDREIASARVEWIRVRYDCARFDAPEAAAEAALAVRADGVRLSDVSDLAGVDVEQVETWVEEAEPALASLLIGACEGDLLGPVDVDEGALVVEIVEKLPVDASDPTIRARAAEAVVARTLRRQVDERVLWHEPV